MAKWYNGFETGIADGTAITIGNSDDGLAGNAFTTIGGGGSSVFSTAQKMHGARSCLINEPTNQRYLAWDGLSLTKASARMYIRYNALPSSNQDQMSIQGGPKIQFITASSIMRYVPVTGSSIDFTTPLVINTWYRYELYAVVGGTSTTGTMKCGFFLGDSVTPVESILDQPGNAGVGTANYTGVRYGKLTGSVALNAHIDSLALDTDVSDLLGPMQGLKAMLRASGTFSQYYPKLRVSGAWNDVIM